MTRIFVLAAVGLLAGGGFQCAIAQDKPDTAPLKAITVSLKGDSESADYYAIWRDVFKDELSKRMEFSKLTNRAPILTTDVFAATFNTTDGKVVVSATDTPDVSCKSFTDIGLSPSLMTCPMRVALIKGKDMKVIYRNDAFAFSIGVDDKGDFENDNEKVRTLVTLDPEKKVLSTHLSEAGPHVEGFKPNIDDTSIELKY